MSSTIKTMLAVLAMLTTFATLAEPVAPWNNLSHQPHYADINGDGQNDLLLQAIDNQHNSSWVAASYDQDGYIQYYQSQQHPLNLDLIDATGISTPVAVEYSLAEWPWLSDELNPISGDFNGDGFADLLLLSQSNQNQQLLHSNAQGQLTLVQSINKNVKWGKVNGDKLLIADFNADGKSDIFAHAKAEGKKHYVVYANETGKLKPANTEQIKAKITDVDWANRNLSEYLELTFLRGGSQDVGCRKLPL